MSQRHNSLSTTSTPCAEQAQKLVCEWHSAVVLFLASNVLAHNFDLRLAHTERAISGLPSEARSTFQALPQPARRHGLDRPDNFCDGFVLTQLGEDVNVIGHAVHDQGYASFLTDHAAEIGE
jgi:hypothetical protein